MNKEQLYKQDKIKREVADLDKEIAFDLNKNQENANKAVERRNAEVADAFAHNNTFLHFMKNFLRAFWMWGDKNELQFWEVGIDKSKSWMTRDGKLIVLEPCYTQKNPNPETGETVTNSGIVMPKGING